MAVNSSRWILVPTLTLSVLVTECSVSILDTVNSSDDSLYGGITALQQRQTSKKAVLYLCLATTFRRYLIDAYILFLYNPQFAKLVLRGLAGLFGCKDNLREEILTWFDS